MIEMKRVSKSKLIHLSPIFQFYTPEKRKKTKRIEMKRWVKMG